jgi:hypothetical protein
VTLVHRLEGPAPTPAAPVAVTAQPIVQKGILVEWRAGDPNGANREAAFEIERCAADAGNCVSRFQLIGKVGGQATSFLDEGVAAGDTYGYRVHAVGPEGDTAPSALVFATMPADPRPETIPLPSPENESLPVPVPPTDPTGTQSGERLPNAGADKVQARNVPPSTGNDPVPVPAPTTQDGRTGEVLPVTYERPAPPAAPSDVQVKEAFESEVTLIWKFGDPQDRARTEFLIERCAGEAGACAGRLAIVGKVGGDTRWFVDSGLQPGTAYTYRVYSLDQYGRSVPSKAVTAYTLPGPSPLPEPPPNRTPTS